MTGRRPLLVLAAGLLLALLAAAPPPAAAQNATSEPTAEGPPLDDSEVPAITPAPAPTPPGGGATSPPTLAATLEAAACPTACLAACPNAPPPAEVGAGAPAGGVAAAEAEEEESIVVTRTLCDPNDREACEANCNGIHGRDSFLADKCCVHTGQSASLLAFEEEDKWVPRIAEFNKCTGAKVRLEYLAEGEDGMADALVADLGKDSDYENGRGSGQGIFDAYIVQAPWITPVANGLESLTPRIRKAADTIRFLDINAASRSAVTFNNTVRALPLDSDYIALGWRQDAFHRHGVPPELSPPRTIQDLADLAERLNGLDHNGDGEPDWGVCLTPQVNYFYAFMAPIIQTALRDPKTNTQTGQNMFFNSETFEPLIRVPAFRTALEHYWRIIRASNCQDQLPRGEKCDRKTAFPTGRCAMVISMPGTLTNMLRADGKYAPRPRVNELTGEVEWDVNDQEIGANGTYWGRRSAFPGSSVVTDWADAEGTLVECSEDTCPNDDGGVNYAPFFAEGGESYALNGRQAKLAARDVMWHMFTWLSELPVTKLPLSGQYRKSHLGDEQREDLTVRAGWPEQMVDDLFEVLGRYFLAEDEGGNPVQDLLMLGFPDYMGALNEELHDNFLGVGKDSTGGIFDRSDPANSLSPENDKEAFDDAYSAFVDSLYARYQAITDDISGGQLGQLQRWRQSLNLPWRTDEELCTAALNLSDQAASFRRLRCDSVVNLASLCQSQPEAVASYDEGLCVSVNAASNSNSISNTTAIIVAVIVPLVILSAIIAYVYVEKKKRSVDSIWAVKSDELKFSDPPEIVGRGTFGLVLLAQYRGTQVAVKRVIPPKMQFQNGSAIEDSLRRKMLGDGYVHHMGTGSTGSFGDTTSSSDDFQTTKNDRRVTGDVAKRKFSDFDFPEDDDDEFLSAMDATSNYRDEEFGLNSQSGNSSGMLGLNSQNGNSSGMILNAGNASTGLPSGRQGKNNRSGRASIKEKLGFRSKDGYEKLKRDFIIEMRHLSTLRHPCITTVMGAVIDKREEPMLVMEYMEHGSLYDILHNETVPLDGDLLLPILQDICQGLRFLHSANPPVIHGDLKAANILVDSKFRAKVADFGLSQKKEIGATGTPYWMAPELLRGESENTSASDVYSFGIILYEVYSRRDPYEGESFAKVISKICDKKVNHRPPVPNACPPAVAAIMKECLVGDADARPAFEELDLHLKRLAAENVEPGDMQMSIQKAQMKKDLKSAENLMYDIFPKHIADALREGKKIEPEHHECVTIFFSDIVGFTTISAAIGPLKVCNMLDRLYAKFDDLSSKHDVLKIETIGDAYLAVCNLVKDQTTDHSKRIAEFAVDAVKAASETAVDEEDPSRGFVEIRVGFHSGPVISDVVGTRLPKYGMFGDTINTASRMESNSKPGRIHCSSAAADLLKVQAPNMPLKSRGVIEIKGKGEMHTWWVNESSSHQCSDPGLL